MVGHQTSISLATPASEQVPSVGGVFTAAAAGGATALVCKMKRGDCLTLTALVSCKMLLAVAPRGPAMASPGRRLRHLSGPSAAKHGTIRPQSGLYRAFNSYFCLSLHIYCGIFTFKSFSHLQRDELGFDLKMVWGVRKPAPRLLPS